jgi:virginiamycin B lyase
MAIDMRASRPNRRPAPVAWLRALALASCLMGPAACGPSSGGVTPSPAPTGTAPSPTPSVSVSASQAAATSSSPTPASPPAVVDLQIREFDVPAGSHPHDVSPATDGGVWYTAQRSGVLGHLDPDTGEVREIPLGAGSAPHGVITGPDGAAWITDSGLNAIVRVDPATDEVTRFPLPSDRPNVNLNTAAFDPSGILWFTGQAGIYGRLDPATADIDVWDDPEGRGPYGITVSADGSVWYASLGGSHIARVDPGTGAATIVEPPTSNQGARRVWADSGRRLWVSEWDAGQVGLHDPATGAWREWRLPGDNPMAYAVFVDDADVVWLTDFGANTIVRFDRTTEVFDSIELPSQNAAVRQLHGRPGEVWGAESAVDKLVVVTNGG